MATAQVAAALISPVRRIIADWRMSITGTGLGWVDDHSRCTNKGSNGSVLVGLMPALGKWQRPWWHPVRQRCRIQLRQRCRLQWAITPKSDSASLWKLDGNGMRLAMLGSVDQRVMKLPLFLEKDGGRV